MKIKAYVKTHNKTGLKYFGKTVKADGVSYAGSGKYWLRHLSKHGNDCTTEVVFSSECQDTLSEFCLEFSRSNDIVASKKWANLIEENGRDGAPIGVKRSDEWKRKLSLANIGKRMSEETKAKISKANTVDWPWESNSCKAYSHVWADLDVVYEWYLMNSAPRRGSIRMSKELGYKSTTTTDNMLRWVKENGDPALNKAWVLFSNKEKTASQSL